MHYVQQPLFASNPAIAEERSTLGKTLEQARRVIDPKMAYEESQYDRSYCIREILYEQYLWDMRCWHKPKFQYTKREIAEYIIKWLKDHEAGNWTYNCGHCLYCIRRLLVMKWASLYEISGLVMSNKNITYHDQIGTWGNGFEKEKEVSL